MNYRHAYHAGNFADVLKHATLALALQRMTAKPAPLRIIDTHAGVGLYDLTGREAGKTGEWRHGIGRLLGPGAEPLPPAVAALLEPYLAAVRAVNPPGSDELVRYPGSPMIARHLLRPGDRLIANEFHPDDNAALAAVLARERRAKVLALDGWTALKSLLPPRERRGLVLVDPPFEAQGELERLTTGLAEAHRRFATGVYLLWFPIKDPRPIARLQHAVLGLGLPKLLFVDLMIRPARDPDRLNGTGLLIANPPYGLSGQLRELAPVLARRLAQEDGGRATVTWLAGDES